MSGFILIFFDDTTELAEPSSLSKPTRAAPSHTARVTHSDQPAPCAVGFTPAGGGADKSTGAISPAPIKTIADYRPNCLNRDACASGALDHCYSCKKAMEAAI